MARKKRSTKPKTPKRTSTRKRTRSAKGIYYDEHFGECTDVSGASTTALSPPVSEQVPVSVAVEQGDSSTESPPVPEQVLVSTAVEQGDHTTTLPPAPGQVPVSVTVEQGDFSTESPPVPEQVPVSTAVEQGDLATKLPPVPEQVPVSTAVEQGDGSCAVLSSLSHQSANVASLSKCMEENEDVNMSPSTLTKETTVCIIDIDTPIISKDGSILTNSGGALLPKHATSTPSFRGANKLFPTKNKYVQPVESFTPVRTGECNNICLKRELELAMSMDVENIENNLEEGNVPNTFPESVVRANCNIVKEIHFDRKPLGHLREEDSTGDFLELMNIYDLYEVTSFCRQNTVKREFEDLVQTQEAWVFRCNMESRNQAEQEMLQLEKHREGMAQVLKAVEKEKEEIKQLLAREKLKNEKLLSLCEQLQKQMAEKYQQQKKSDDEIKQLRSTNTYRQEVIRLEKFIENLETEKSEMRENLMKQREEIDMVRESLSNFITENTLLKNDAKLRKKELMNSLTVADIQEVSFSDIGMQTDSVGNCTYSKTANSSTDRGVCFRVDFGVDASVQTNQLFGCKKCEENEHLIYELIQLLDTMERSVAYTQALECDQNFLELVKHLDVIDAELMALNCKQSKDGLEMDGGLKNTGKISVHPLETSYTPSLHDTTLSQMNRFHPLQYINNTNDNQFSSNLQPSISQPLRQVPGAKLYSETVQGLATTMIVTDSMSGGVKANNIKRNLKGKEKIIFKRFPGHTAEEISFYAQKPLNDLKPEKVIIVAGTNDITKNMYENMADEYSVVESIMKIGREARKHGAKKIHISSIMVRKGYRYGDVLRKVNELLYMACVAEDFLFLDQADITMAHISSDGIHLNSHGSAILLYNILSLFDAFDRNFIDFNADYEYAISIS